MELAASFDAQLSSLAPFIFYLVVAAIVFIETGLLFGFFLPGDSILFSAGLVAASHGNINIVILVTAIFLAAFFGDQVGFVIGRVIGRPYLDKRQSPRMKKMIANAENFHRQTLADTSAQAYTAHPPTHTWMYVRVFRVRCEKRNETAIPVAQLSARNRADTTSTAGSGTG